MYYRKQGDEKRMKRLLCRQHRYRPCGAHYKDGVLTRYYKSDWGTYKFYKREAARLQRHREKRTLERWPRRLFDPSWKYY